MSAVAAPHGPDERAIRDALRCGRPCECKRPRGKIHCPAHDPGAGTPDLDVATKGGQVLVICRAGCTQDAVIAELQARELWPRKQADVVPIRSTAKTTTTTRNEIRDVEGVLHAIHPREDLENGDKKFAWWLPGAKKPGLGGRKPTSLPLYGSERLKDLPDRALVLVCEGEKATDAARMLGYEAVGTVCGAPHIPDDAVLAPLVRLTPVLWADHDDPGDRQMRGIADRLHARGGTCYRFDPGTEPKDDAADFADRGGTHEQLEAMLTALAPYDPIAERLAGVKLWTGRELYAERFPEPKTIVPTLLPEGAVILAGAPKMGKSRLALNLGIAVASGGRALGSIAVEDGDVLYLALEDGARRTQQRAMLLSADAPPRLEFAFTWERLDAGGLDMLRAWCQLHPAARLIVIDTAERIRPASSGKQQLYREDYSFLAPLNDLALEHHIAVVVVHHSNKNEPSDPLSLISGSFGLSGAVDGAIVLKRERGRSDATLHVHHRDLWDSEYALKVDQDVGSWVLLGDAEEYRLSSERAEIVNAVRDAGQPVGPKQVADQIGKSHRSAIKLMGTMAKQGLLTIAAYGKYTIPPTPKYPYVERD